MRYAFADSDVAARRLRLVADVFDRSTAAFVAAAVRRAAALALYAGALLEALGDVGALRKRTSTVTRLPVADRRAAAMFALNLAAWGDDLDVRARHGEDRLTRLGALLRAMADRVDDESTITWGLRQIVFERTG